MSLVLSPWSLVICPITFDQGPRCEGVRRTKDNGRRTAFLNLFFHHLPRNQPLLRMAFDDFFQKVACFAAAGGRFFLLQPLLQRLTARGLNHHQSGARDPQSARMLAIAAEQRFRTAGVKPALVSEGTSTGSAGGKLRQETA